MTFLIPSNVPLSDIRLALAKALRCVRVCQQSMRFASERGDLRLYASSRSALGRFEAKASGYRNVIASRSGVAA